MRLPRKCDAITEWLQVVDDTLRPVFGERVIRIRPRFDRVLSGVNVVPRGRAHGRRLETVLELHALFGQLVRVGRVGLSAVRRHITERAVIRDNENEVRFVSRLNDSSGHRNGKQQRVSHSPVVLVR